jgi:hypothetical protein
MKTKLTFLFIAICSIAVADTIAYDSAANHEAIVGGVNGILNSVPPVNPIVDGIKYTLIALGGFITAKCIGFFKKRNKDKK